MSDFKAFINFQGLFKDLTGSAITQEQTEIYEKWHQSKLDDLIFSIGDAIDILQAAWLVLEEDQPDSLKNIPLDTLYRILEQVETSRVNLEYYQKSYER